jgi:predicted acetyltransferase
MGHQARQAHQEDVPTSCIDTQNVFLCRDPIATQRAVRGGGWLTDMPKCGCTGMAASDIHVTVPQLSLPVEHVHRSFLAAMAEFRAEGRGDLVDHSMIGAELREFGHRWVMPEGFAAYVGWLRSQALEDSPRPEGHVPSTTLWWVEGEEYLGRVAIRHRLTAHLLEIGGHIGYDVRPSARRRGHATAMLGAALPVARGLCIASALVTCDVTNLASRKVIEANGGVFDDQRGEKLRFWVPTT